MRFAATLCLVTSVAAATLTAPQHTASSTTPERACTATVVRDLTGQLETWDAAFAGGDPEALSAIYGQQAILMGIGEAAILIGRDDIAKHYTGLLVRRPLLTTVSRAIEPTCSQAMVTGRQILAVGDHRHDVAYRMHFALVDGHWRLLHHHVAALDGQDIVLPVLRAANEPARASTLATATLPATIATAPKAPTDEQGLPDIVIPSPTFSLPQTPPVFLSPMLPQILSTARAETTRVEVPPLNLLLGDFPVLAPAATPFEQVVDAQPAPIDVIVSPSFKLADGPPEVPLVAIFVSVMPIQANLQPVQQAPVSTPPAPPETAGATTTTPTSPPTARPEEPVAARPAPGPAVAGFSQRAPTPTPPPVTTARAASASANAKTAPKAAPQAKSATVAAKSSSKYRPARGWIDSTPVFDD